MLERQYPRLTVHVAHFSLDCLMNLSYIIGLAWMLLKGCRANPQFVSKQIHFTCSGVLLWRKINLWSNKTSVPYQPFSEICFHDNRM